VAGSGNADEPDRSCCRRRRERRVVHRRRRARGGGVSTVGAAGAGDPYFPRQGNGGYQVQHYGLRIDYRPATHHLSGHAHIVARTTKQLSRFDLDLRQSMRVQSVRVNGTTTTFASRSRWCRSS